MNPAAQRNTYLDEVLQQQEKVDEELSRKRKSVTALAPAGGGGGPAAPGPAGRAADYRITGFWRFRTVVVAPNVYVVHTRRGHTKPLHIGMGISFRFDPARDSFLAIPAAVQTLIINARSICSERQGILIQAYVQWIIDDIEIAYRKLDFSDPDDPMRVVNIQLREQAEAAIKDKVATMSIDAVLSDKQSIIDELTHRLRTVAEGGRQGDSGLGLKIVTVQIKEAVVSSPSVWENLQRPFRAERAQFARLAELASESVISQRELDNRRESEGAELRLSSELALIRAEEERRVFDRQQAERVRRQQLEQEAERAAVLEAATTRRQREDAETELQLHALALEQRRRAAQVEALAEQLALIKAKSKADQAELEQELDAARRRHEAELSRASKDFDLERLRHDLANQLSEPHLRRLLIERLPELAGQLPHPREQRLISISGGDSQPPALFSSLAGLLTLLEDTLRARQGDTDDADD